MRGRHKLSEVQSGESPVLVVRLPQWLMDALDHQVANSDQTRSQIVREVLQGWLGVKEPDAFDYDHYIESL